MSRTATLASVPDINFDFVRLINDEHKKAEAAIDDWFVHAVTIGRILVEARSTITEPWGEWRKTNLTFTAKTEQVYRCAYLYETIIRKRGDLSTRGVLAARSQEGLNVGTRGKVRSAPPEVKRYINARRSENVTWGEIATELGQEQRTIRAYVDPDFAKQRNEYEAARRRQTRHEQRLGKAAAIRKERDALARGTNLSVAYGHVRKLQQELDRELSALAPSQRAALRSALTKAQQCEDSIMAALHGKAA